MCIRRSARWLAASNEQAVIARPAVIRAVLKGAAMSPVMKGLDAATRDELLVHNWRVSQLERLGVPLPLSAVYADRVDWHEVARLVQRGCPPPLALRIAS